MIGVGGTKSGQCRISGLPPSAERVEKQACAYASKLVTSTGSEEERFSLALLRNALARELGVALDGLRFLHQEWRFAGAKSRIDILAVLPGEGRLVVIELKKDERTARAKDSAKGGDAWDQANSYASLLFQQRATLYPYFQRLGRALAVAHEAPETMRTLALRDESPKVLIGWPGGEFRWRR